MPDTFAILAPRHKRARLAGDLVELAIYGVFCDQGPLRESQLYYLSMK